MKICYVVYREDNTMVFISQVLEYLQLIKEYGDIECVELILFKNEQNTKTIEEVTKQVSEYVDSCHIIPSLPVLSKMQLDINASRMRHYVEKAYGDLDRVGVICRGELATYVSIKAFRSIPNSRILYDNRGLPYEESKLSYPNNIIHMINRSIKKRIIKNVRNKCDCYNFVTSAMRKYLIQEYCFDSNRPYTVIPTLFKNENGEEVLSTDFDGFSRIQLDQLVVLYSGSTEKWQSIEKLIKTVESILSTYSQSTCFILTNGELPGIETLGPQIKERIVIKSVPHKQMKYYLKIADVGIVIRDDNIVNKVAAPTKIAEYLTNGIQVLSSGSIGILDDVSNSLHRSVYINIDKNTNWLEQLHKKDNLAVPEDVRNYFDMRKRQADTIDMLNSVLKNNKLSN